MATTEQTQSIIKRNATRILLLLALLLMTSQAYAVFCNQCGQQNPDNARFCAKCGNKLVSASALRDQGKGRFVVKKLTMTDYYNSLVFVQTDKGDGSGFIVTINGSDYIITNQHVLFGADLKSIRFTNVTGDQLLPKKIEFSKTLDLVRIRFRPKPKKLIKPFELSEATPKINQPISALSDPGGKKVFVQSAGKLVGVGNDQIEYDADTIPGSSGGPIVDNEGKVLGAVTYGMKHMADWLNEDTRFSQKARRFAARIPTDESNWCDISIKDFLEQCYVIEDLKVFLVDVLYLVSNLNNCQEYLKNPAERKKKFHNKKLHGKVQNLAKTIESIVQVRGGRKEVFQAVDEYYKNAKGYVGLLENTINKLEWKTEFLENMAKALLEPTGALKKALEKDKQVRTQNIEKAILVSEAKLRTAINQLDQQISILKRSNGDRKLLRQYMDKRKELAKELDKLVRK